MRIEDTYITYSNKGDGKKAIRIYELRKWESLIVNLYWVRCARVTVSQGKLKHVTQMAEFSVRTSQRKRHIEKEAQEEETAQSAKEKGKGATPQSSPIDMVGVR